MGFGRSPMVGDAYIPFAQKPTLQVSVMLRTAAPLAEAAVATLRESITAIDPGVPVFDVAPMIRRVRGDEAVLRQGIVPVGVGVALGLGAAVGLSRLIERLLYRVDGADPLTYAEVVGVVLVASLAACYLPARCAARVEPMEVLREV